MIPRDLPTSQMTYWNGQADILKWCAAVDNSLKKPPHSWSLYIHIPYCERLCAFCCCNTSITSNHKLEEEYIENLFSELNFYIENTSSLTQTPCDGIYLGGGTPTFISASNWESFFKTLKNRVSVSPDWEGYVEIDPRHINKEQLTVFKNHGLKNLIVGVQDIDEKVLLTADRFFPLSKLKNFFHDLKEEGFSVGAEIIVGLLGQSDQTMENLYDELTTWVKEQHIARLHSYNYIPLESNQGYRKKHRKKAGSEISLPNPDQVDLWQTQLRVRLSSLGWKNFSPGFFIGPHDNLYHKNTSQVIHRSCGYWQKGQRLLLGLGVSAISEAQGILKQNEKVLPIWQRDIKNMTPSSKVLCSNSHVYAESKKEEYFD